MWAKNYKEYRSILSFVFACARRNCIKITVIAHSSILSFPLSLFFVITQMSCVDEGRSNVISPLGEFEVRGKLSSADENASQAEVVILSAGRKLDPEVTSRIGKSFLFNIQPGDISLLKNKEVFRGKVQKTFAPSSGKSYLLHQVWPDEQSERIRFSNANPVSYTHLTLPTT